MKDPASYEEAVMKDKRMIMSPSSVEFLKTLAEKMKTLASAKYAGLCRPYEQDLTSYVRDMAITGEGDVLSHALDRLDAAEEDYAAMSNRIGNAQHMLFEMEPETEEAREMKEKLLDALTSSKERS